MTVFPSNASSRNPFPRPCELRLPGERASIVGCDRERDDLVGDWYEARPEVEVRGRLLDSDSSRLTAATEVVGDVLRRFAGDGGISLRLCGRSDGHPASVIALFTAVGFDVVLQRCLL